MSEPENFLARWSRRKQGAAEQPAEPHSEPESPASPEDATRAAADAPAQPAAAAENKPEPEFDLSSLPSIESIGADTDIRPFLRAGVPADLTRAALRRAWETDPAIRNYIGLSENAWDFTKPDGHGFDFSDPKVDVRQLAEQMFGGGAKPTEAEAGELSTAPQTTGPSAEIKASTGVSPLVAQAEAPAEAPPSEPDPALREDSVTVSKNENGASDEAAGTGVQVPARRKHGGALPS